jgi:hypothetical protein
MLDDLDCEKSIQDIWKNVFVADRLGAERDLKERMIAIRFIIQRDLVVCRFYIQVIRTYSYRSNKAIVCRTLTVTMVTTAWIPRNPPRFVHQLSNESIPRSVARSARLFLCVPLHTAILQSRSLRFALLAAWV